MAFHARTACQTLKLMAVANFTDGPSVSAGCRERPSLIFAEDGFTPITLVNGFSPNPSDVGRRPSGSCRYSGVDYSFTLVQPVRRGRT